MWYQQYSGAVLPPSVMVLLWKNGIRDACSTADYGPLLSIVIRCYPLLSIVVQCCLLLLSTADIIDCLMVFKTIYSSFPISCKGIPWTQNSLSTSVGGLCWKLGTSVVSKTLLPSFQASLSGKIWFEHNFFLFWLVTSFVCPTVLNNTSSAKHGCWSLV